MDLLKSGTEATHQNVALTESVKSFATQKGIDIKVIFKTYYIEQYG